VVVDVDLRLLPEHEFVGLRRQRSQRGAIERLEELAARLNELAHRAVVEALDQWRHLRAQLGERVEGPIAEDREDPALRQEHSLLDLRLVPGMVGARGQDRRAVVLGELGVGRVELGVVVVGARDAAFQIVGD